MTRSNCASGPSDDQMLLRAGWSSQSELRSSHFLIDFSVGSYIFFSSEPGQLLPDNMGNECSLVCQLVFPLLVGLSVCTDLQVLKMNVDLV